MADGRKNNGAKKGEDRGAGRKKGSFNKDKKALRDKAAAAVLEFTTLRRKQDLANGISPDEAQPIYEDYCPVTQLMVLGSDIREKSTTRLAANSQAAQYITPKLKAIEVTNDPDENDSRRELSAVLQQMITNRSRPTAAEEEETYDRGTEPSD